jgi:hypothetical protein
MAGFVPEITPSVDKWNTEQSVGAGRPWDGCGVRYNAVTPGVPYSQPGSSQPEEARALLILTGTGNITVNQVQAVGSQPVTFVGLTAPVIFPLATSQVVSVTGLSNIYWISC